MSRPRLLGSAFISRSLTTIDRTVRTIEQQRPPRSIARRIAVAEREVAGWTVFTLTPAEPLLPTDGAGDHLLALHGAVDAPGFQHVPWSQLARLAERTGRTVSVPVYASGADESGRTLALPAQLLDVYDALVDDAGDPSAVAVVGEGAGTDLATELIRSTASTGLPSGNLVAAF